jgi:hypothetical protein
VAQYPPAPPPSSSGPSAARPGVVTAAGILLIVVGGLQCLLGLIALLGGAALGSAGRGFLAVFGIIFLAIGLLHIYAGVQVLALKERGRMIGIVIAAIGAVLGLLRIAAAPGSGIIGIAIDGFIIWALTQNASYFTA